MKHLLVAVSLEQEDMALCTYSLLVQVFAVERNVLLLFGAMVKVTDASMTRACLVMLKSAQYRLISWTKIIVEQGREVSPMCTEVE